MALVDTHPFSDIHLDAALISLRADSSKGIVCVRPNVTAVKLADDPAKSELALHCLICGTVDIFSKPRGSGWNRVPYIGDGCCGCENISRSS